MSAERRAPARALRALLAFAVFAAALGPVSPSIAQAGPAVGAAEDAQPPPDGGLSGADAVGDAERAAVSGPPPAPLVRPSLTKKENLYTGEADPVADWAKTILTRRRDRVDIEAVTRKFYDSMYTGFGFSQATISPETTSEFVLSDDFSNARRVFVGYAIREWLAVEFYLTDLGHVEVIQETRDEKLNSWSLAYEEKGVLLYAITPYPRFVSQLFRRWSGVELERHFKPYFHVGYSDLDFAWTGAADAIVDESSNQFLLGAGFVANFANRWIRWQLRFGFTQYGTDVGAFGIDWVLFSPGTGY